MIIYLLIIAVLALFISMTMISNSAARIIASLVSAGVVIASMFFMISNDHDHFGMKKVTETNTSSLYSVSPSKQMSMLLYKNIGTKGTEKVYVYKTDKNQKNPSHTATDNKTTNKIKTTSSDPKLVTKTTRWEYKNGAYKFWFGIADNNKKKAYSTNTFYVGSDWQVFSTTQAQRLQKLSKAKQASMKADAEKYVKAKIAVDVKKAVMTAMKKDPTMSPTERQKLIQTTSKQLAPKYAAQYQAQAMQELIKEAKQVK